MKPHKISAFQKLSREFNQALADLEKSETELQSRMEKVDSLRQKLKTVTKIGEYWKLMESEYNLQFMLTNIEMFLPPIESDGTFSPEGERYCVLLAISSLFQVGAFEKLLEAFGEHKDLFLDTIFPEIENSLSLFETALLLSPIVIRSKISAVCEKHNFPTYEAALRSHEFYQMYPPKEQATIQKAFNSGEINEYLIEQIRNSEVFYHVSFLKLAYHVFGMPIEIVDAIIPYMEPSTRIKLLKQKLEYSSKLEEYWKVVEAEDNWNFILNHITHFIPKLEAGIIPPPTTQRACATLATICASKPRAFGTILQTLGNNKTIFLENMLSCRGYDNMPLFETVLIMAPSQVCSIINTIYKESDAALPANEHIGYALDNCCLLNSIIYDTKNPEYIPALRKAFSLHYKIPTLQSLSMQINEFPVRYHRNIVYLAHQAFSFSLGEIIFEVGAKSSAAYEYCQTLLKKPLSNAATTSASSEESSVPQL